MSAAGGILIVGGGLIGSSLVSRLEGASRPTRLLTRRQHVTGVPNPSCVMVGNADDPSVCEIALDGCDTVVWCTGDLTPASPASELARIDDVTPLVTMLRALDEGARFIFISSGGAVYGRPDRIPVVESSPLLPVSIYGAIKAVSEAWIHRFEQRTRIIPTVLRCGNVYGPGQRTRPTHGVIAHAFACSLEGRALPAIGDLESMRDYVFIDDVVDVIEACLDGRVSAPILNVGSATATPLRELFAQIRAITGELQTVPVPSRPMDVDQIVLDITKLHRELPEFDPTPLTLGLERTWASLHADLRCD